MAKRAACLLPQEVHDAVTAQRAADANAQRRCGLMFELSVNLERLLEFLASQLPAAFRCAPSVAGQYIPRG